VKHIQTFKLFEKFVVSKTKTTFKEWFGKSKVIENGKPQVVYHGTPNKFLKFDKTYGGRTDDGFYGKGFYFAKNKIDAEEYGANIMEVYLKIENPFWLRDDGSMNSPVLLDVRDDIYAAIPGLPKGLKTNREVPKGYQLKRREEDNNKGDSMIIYAIWPTNELYDTPKEIYGPDISTYANAKNIDEESMKIQAIVAFNDQVAAGREDNGKGYQRQSVWDTGWTSQLLKQLGRDNFNQKLADQGYDGVFVVTVQRLGEELTIDKVDEFIAFDPRQIKSASNSGNFDHESDNIYEKDDI